MTIKSVFFLLIFMLSQTLIAQTPDLEPGISQKLAKWRAAHYSDVRYKLNILLEKGAPLMKGTIEIRVNLTDEGAKNDLILDWRTTQFANDKDKPFANVVAINGAERTGAKTSSPANETTGAQTSSPANETTGSQASSLANVAESGVKTLDSEEVSFLRTSFSRSALIASGTLALQSNEHLIIPKKFLKTGENVIKIEFASPIKTSGAAMTRYVDKEDGAEYVYSLFVPSDASTAFPVFDQPDLKAKFSLRIVAPLEWKVVSNENSIERVELFSSEKAEKEKKIEKLPNGNTLESVKVDAALTVFRTTRPISTYVFAFAAGDFVEFTDDRGKGGNATAKERADIQASARTGSRTLPSGRVSALNEYNMVFGDRDIVSNVYVRKSQAGKFKQHADEVFRLNRESVKYLEEWFDYKFPFPKYDLVLIPEFPFGGMEHAGATFLREDRVIFPTEPTKNDYITRANLIFHEAAHQWFGDTVTMRWFDDLWLKEGFAEFMAYKTLEKVLPEYNAWKVFYERNKQAAYLTDVTRGTTPIYQEIPNLASAKSAYGNIVYRKAPSFLRQAEFYLGEKEFQTAVRAFLKKHEFANATWQDLVNEFETASKQDLKDWANIWVTQRSLPIVRVERNEIEVETESGKKVNAEYFILDETTTENKPGLWKMKTIVLYRNDKGVNRKEIVKLNDFSQTGSGENSEFIALLQNRLRQFNIEQIRKLHDRAESGEKIDFIFPNYQDYGYGIFLLDEKSRAYVLANIHNEKDAFLRSMMWGSLWDAVRFYELAPEDYVKLVIKNINVEQDESTIQTLLGRVSTAMNYYIPESGNANIKGGNATAKEREMPNAESTLPRGRVSAKDALAAALEKLLINKIETAPTVGQKITYFRALQSIGSGEQTKQLFKDLINGKSRLKGTELKTKDKFDLVTRLIILGDKDALDILAELEKQYTDDAAKRYAYAAKAGIPTAENKAKYWKDFTENKEISESWIESAFNVWNTPRHAELTLPYLEKALAELPNLKKNRKIFFVNGWLGAFIGGQKSVEALNIVNKFLDENPNLDKDLRNKILENADNLERAVEVRKKFGKGA